VRVAFVTETWLPSVNGVVTRLTATIEQLCRDGHDVLVIAPRRAEGDERASAIGRSTESDDLAAARSDDDSRPTDAVELPLQSLRTDGVPGPEVVGVPTFRLQFIYGGEPWGLPSPAVERALRHFRPDVVHVVNPVMLGIAGVVAARRLRLPLVCSYHTNVARYAHYYHLGWLAPVTERLLRWLHRQATLNLATSQSAVAELERQGIESVRLWRRGVDLNRFRPTRRRRPATPAPCPEALYVGRLAQEKSIERLLPLAESGAALTLVGDGPDRERLGRRFAGTGARFIGPLVGEDLADAFANADVFVFPSTTETLGLVLLEALASGLPVVAPDTPASQEVLADCPAARVFDPSDPNTIPRLVAELTDPSCWAACSADARRAAEQWGWEAATKELLGYYEEAIVAGAKGGRRGHSLRQLIRFLAVGVSNAVIDVGVFNALILGLPTHSTVHLIAYNTIAVIAAITNSYLWNTRWTFRAERATTRRGRWRQRSGFIAQSLINIVLNDAVLGTAVSLIRLAHLSPTLTNNAAKLAAMFVSSSASFLIMKFVVFRPWGRRRPPGGLAAAPLGRRVAAHR